MANVNTGKQRSLTLAVTKTINGAPSDGSTTTYDGRLAFGTYAAITNTQLAEIPNADYTKRLTAFKTYVQNVELGLIIDNSTEVGHEAYRTNTSACPIGL